MLRRKETIILPAGYYESFADVGHLTNYPDDWQVYDFKIRSDQLIRRPASLKITESKILEISTPPAALVVKNNYSALGCTHALLKRGKRWIRILPDVVPEQSGVKAEKKKDVWKLITVMGQHGVEVIESLYQPICITEIVNNDVSSSTSELEEETITNVNEDEW